MQRVALLDLSGAILYDAIILEAALAHGSKALYTWNIKDFSRLAQGENIAIKTPNDV